MTFSMIMSQLYDFWSLSNPNVRWVLLGSILLGAATGVIGSFAFLQKRSLTGDVLAHATLPGVTLAFLVFGRKDAFTLLLGAMLSCSVAYLFLLYLNARTKIKEDSAFAIVLSSFFALGIFLLTYIQKQGSGSHSGLDKLLFGQAASLMPSDLLLLSFIACGVLLTAVIFFRTLRVILFDPSFASAQGLSITRYQLMIALLLIIVVVIGLQLIGVVLMTALLLTPAAAARYWTNRMDLLLILAGCFGAVAGIFGAQLSFIAPRMPSGPWMVIGLSLIFCISFIFAPQRGLLSYYRKQSRHRNRSRQENILRTLYKLGENSKQMLHTHSISEVLRYRPMPLAHFEQSVDVLRSQGLIIQHADSLQLTVAGETAAALITRRHRLWELYLTHQVHISSDHVHDDAEEIEHILTPELMNKLEQELASAVRDPHGKEIPKAEV